MQVLKVSKLWWQLQSGGKSLQISNMTTCTRVRWLAFGWLAALALSSGLNAADGSWTDRQGRTIQAEFVSFDPAAAKVKLRLPNGTEPLIDLARLCDEDQGWILARQKREEEAAAAAKQNAGKVVDYVSDGPEAVSYHVYYPTSFEPLKPPAMLVVFSPGGNGKGILKSVQEGCENLGWIGVGCDVFKNGVSESVLDPKWQEVLPHIEKTVPHDPDLLYLGGMSGGAARAYDYSEVTKRPWKGVLAFGGWLGGKSKLGCPPKMAVAQVNGDQDHNANAWAQKDADVLKRADAEVKKFSFPGGHVVAPAPVVLEALQWLKENTVPGNRLPDGKRHTAELDRDNGTKTK